MPMGSGSCSSQSGGGPWVGLHSSQHRAGGYSGSCPTEAQGTELEQKEWETQVWALERLAHLHRPPKKDSLWRGHD